MIGLIFHLCLASLRLSRRFGQVSIIHDPALLELFAQCRKTLGIHASLTLAESPNITTPAVQGVWKPRLLLPTGFVRQVSEEDLRFIFLHELGHVRRHDLAINWLVACLQVIHWFNPLVWLGFARWHADRELACDALVLESAGANQNQDYSRTILRLLENQAFHPASPSLAGILEDRRELKRRISMILRFKKSTRRPLLAAFTMLALGMATLTDARLNSEPRVDLSNPRENITNRSLHLAFAQSEHNEEASKTDAVEAPIDLLIKYPTTLTNSDTNPERARAWDISSSDIFCLKDFTFRIENALAVHTGPADLGIGHSTDGAVWAIVIPRGEGKLSSSQAKEEKIAHVWLRFHPREISHLFPTATILGAGSNSLLPQMRAIANLKMNSSWQSNNNAMIPPPEDLTVDFDTVGGPRRFFVVNTQRKSAEYVADFEERSYRRPQRFSVANAERAFDQLWKEFDENYAMFVLRPEVDWTKLRDEYRPKAKECKSTEEFASVCVNLLKPLRDLHVWLTVSGANVPVFNRPRTRNANPAAFKSLLGSLSPEKHRVSWALTTNKIGYISVSGWSDDITPKTCDEALEQMRDTRGLIVDVRLNGGGSENLACLFAGRFLTNKFVYAYSQFRDGASHTNLTEKYERTVKARGPWRYDRPVVVLIGQKCMSSNESFIGMMSGDPDATLMGDHSCGSSGNPKMVDLPMEITVSIPQWIDYLPDGTPLDERGFQPNIPFKASPGAFEGNRDDLLSAALERLGTAPLPEKKISGPPVNGETKSANGKENQAALRTNQPKVISVSPAAGAEDVGLVTEIRIRFDRPMNSQALGLDWLQGSFRPNGSYRYNDANHEFIIPVMLAPETENEIVVNYNPFPQGGNNTDEDLTYSLGGWYFMDEAKKAAQEFRWVFTTGGVASKTASAPPVKIEITPNSKTQVPMLTLLQLTFDEPILPDQSFVKLTFPKTQNFPGEIQDLAGLIPYFDYDATSRRLTLPISLEPDKTVKMSLSGIYSASGQWCAPIPLVYAANKEEFSPALRQLMDETKKNPELIQLLNSMKKARQHLHSGEETVLQYSSHMGDKGGFGNIFATSAIFKWQDQDCVFGDITGPMGTLQPILLGSDGKTCWMFNSSKDTNILQSCGPGEVPNKSISLADPFVLLQLSVPDAINQMHLTSLIKTQLDGHPCYRVQGWNTRTDLPIVSMMHWWIDEATYLPLQVTEYSKYGQFTYRYEFRNLNQKMDLAAFQPPSSKIPVKAISYSSEGDKRCFFQIGDGANGHMTGRIGTISPTERCSGGLN